MNWDCVCVYFTDVWILHIPRYPDFVLPCLGLHPVQGALTGDQRCVTLQVTILLLKEQLIQEWIHKSLMYTNKFK